ncbi:MAG TPA: hypothetical protein VGS01_09570 [Candidatus Limnocylindria bacterium]|nr:hypothetical protein [Candidatus Limnocylindria bacterium]
MNPPVVGVCGDCRGTGEVTVYTCPGFIASKVRCSACRGIGRIDDARAAELTEGLRRRADRLERRLSQREEAARLGMDVVAYSRLEHPR